MTSARILIGWMVAISAATVAGWLFGLFDQLRFDSSVFVSVLLAIFV